VAVLVAAVMVEGRLLSSHARAASFRSMLEVSGAKCHVSQSIHDAATASNPAKPAPPPPAATRKAEILKAMDVQIVSKPPTAPPSGVAMLDPALPPKEWRLTFAEDFNFNVEAPEPSKTNSQAPAPASGGFLHHPHYAFKFQGYDIGTKDQSGKGFYDETSTLSVKDGVLSMFLHSEDEKGVKRLGVPKVVGLVPIPDKCKEGQSSAQTAGNIAEVEPCSTRALGSLYGRWSMRFRTEGDKSFRFFGLLTSNANKCEEGQVAFPAVPSLKDGEVLGEFFGAVNDPKVEILKSKATSGSWHTATIEWTPAKVELFIDRVSIGTVTTNVPTHPLHFALQAETSTDPAPHATDEARVFIDWITIHERV